MSAITVAAAAAAAAAASQSVPLNATCLPFLGAFDFCLECLHS